MKTSNTNTVLVMLAPMSLLVAGVVTWSGVSCGSTRESTCRCQEELSTGDVGARIAGSLAGVPLLDEGSIAGVCVPPDGRSDCVDDAVSAVSESASAAKVPDGSGGGNLGGSLIFSSKSRGSSIAGLSSKKRARVDAFAKYESSRSPLSGLPAFGGPAVRKPAPAEGANVLPRGAEGVSTPLDGRKAPEKPVAGSTPQPGFEDDDTTGDVGWNGDLTDEEWSSFMFGSWVGPQDILAFLSAWSAAQVPPSGHDIQTVTQGAASGSKEYQQPAP